MASSGPVGLLGTIAQGGWSLLTKAQVTATAWIGGAQRKVEDLTSDRSASLLGNAGYNLFVDVAVRKAADSAQKNLIAEESREPCDEKCSIIIYNPIEFLTDSGLHGVNFVALMAEWMTTKDSPQLQKYAVKKFTDLTLILNKVRLAAIVGSMIYRTNTIDWRLEVLDAGNHKFTIYILNKHRYRDDPKTDAATN